MARVLADSEIHSLLGEPKKLPRNWSKRLKTKAKQNSQHLQSDIEILRDTASFFRLVTRRNKENPLDFSVILVFNERGIDYTLRRCNGKHPSRHTNHWERRRGLANDRFGPNFHIHMATERYQTEGLAIDGYAEVTTRYSDFEGALEALLVDCGFEREEPRQPKLL